MRRFSLALMATIVAALAVASTASATITPGKLNLHFTSAKVVLGNTTTLDVPGTDPTLQGKTIDVAAGIDATGKISAFRNALSFPSIPFSVSGFDLTVSIIQTAKSFGQLDDATSAVTLPLNLGVLLDTGGVLPNCTIALPFAFDTGTHEVVSGKNVVGVPYDPGTGALTLAANATIPTVVPASTLCPADAATTVTGLLGAAGVSAVGIELSGTLSMPGGTAPADPDAVTTTLTASTATLGSTKVSAAKGVAIKCGGTPATVKSCTGAASLSVTTLTTKTVTKKVKGKKKKVKVTTKKVVKLPAVSYTAAAGASSTVKFKVSSAVSKSLKANKSKLAGVLSVTNTNGTGVSKKKVSLVK